MKALFCILAFLFTGQKTIEAQCPSGNYTVSGNALITNSCTINGDLVILNGATLNVDFTSSVSDTFVVRGNIVLKGNAILWVHASEGSINDQFIISNNFNDQRSVTTLDSSIIKLENIEIKTQEGNLSNAASIYMNYWAEGKSIFYVSKTRLDPTRAWLLFNMKNKSTLIGYETEHVPTEIYVQDTAQVSLHGQKTNTGIWLNFENITGTFNLPANQTVPFSWKLGRGAGGINTPWYLEMDTVRAGVGVQIFPSSNITINGSGFPMTGELKVALMFANGTDTINNLVVGLQNKTISNGINGRIKLNNVNGCNPILM